MPRFIMGLMAIAAMWSVSSASAHAAGQERVPLLVTSASELKVHRVELAQAGAGNVNIDVLSACVGGVATFKIVNKGETWPRLGTLKVVRVDDQNIKTIAQREMRFAKGQKASFRVKKATGETVGLFVQPSWYDRPFTYDAKVSCK